MKRWLKSWLGTDDLVFRVFYAAYGALPAAGATLMGWHLATGSLVVERAWDVVLLSGIVAVLLAWAGVLFAAALAAPHRAVSRWGPKLAADGCEVAGIILIIVLFIPVLLITPLLRVIGLRGYEEVEDR